MWNSAKDKFSGITAEELKEVFEYDPNDGYLRWKVARKRIVRGSIAGYTSKSDGYHYVGFNHKEYCAHRLIWLIMSGEWPIDQIDHINGIRSDNRWCNLRQVTNSQGNINQVLSRRNKSGVRGVDIIHGAYRVRIHKDGNEIAVGRYSTLDEAAKARKEAEVHYFGEFSPDQARSSVRFLRKKKLLREKPVILRDMKPDDYFIKFVEVDEETGCWNWKGAISSSGYGQFSNKHVNNGIGLAASRAAWLMFKDKNLKSADFVCHTCDNRLCCNPDHLFLGTQKINMEDCAAKGRMNRGEDRPQAKLTEENVKEARRLRQQGMGWRKLADKFGVVPYCIISAVMGKTWAHVDEPIPTYVGKSGAPKRKRARLA